MKHEEQYKPAEQLELQNLSKEKDKSFVKISCPSCSSEISASNIHLDKNMAKCGSCNALFSINDEIEHLHQKERKQEIIRPEGVDIFYFKDDMDITVRPKTMKALDAFGIFIMPLFALLFIAVYFKKGMPVYIPGVFSAASIYFIYRMFVYSQDKSYIEVNDDTLRIRHRPKYFKKDRILNSAEIEQLYLKQSVDGMGNYDIHMLINGIEGQRHEKLLTLKSLSAAKYLEQEIEKHLGIKERKVPEATV